MKLHLSYSSEKTKITVQNEVVEIKAFQIIVWVSISTDDLSAWDHRIPIFPAILDIGNNHNFALTEEHLTKWAGIHLSSLAELNMMREKGMRVPLRRAGLWLHTDGDPFSLFVEDGIVVHESHGPRLPILGLRALTNSRLQTFVYGDTKQVIIRTPPKWYWPF